MTVIRTTDTDNPAREVRVEPSVSYERGAYICTGGHAHLTPDETRQLRDELTVILGEVTAPASIKVGDRVVVVAEEPDGESSRLDGKTGLVVKVDISGQDRYPYLVADIDGVSSGVWCHSVRLIDEPDEDPELADHIAVSAAQDAADAADVARRHGAAVKARELLIGSASPFASAVPAEERIIRLAEWLLGESA
ncbi:hypothetical protein [Kitasatospora sp. NPDC050543]|uniref:hypothetical protein n=1 Tax=Kitasatospora sp. NPDC050543 TaxID=3364054 RepID=UPI00379C32B1